jgi:hypothetical protein
MNHIQLYHNHSNHSNGFWACCQLINANLSGLVTRRELMCPQMKCVFFVMTECVETLLTEWPYLKCDNEETGN